MTLRGRTQSDATALKEGRINQVVAMMLNGTFVTGVTYKALAVEWGTSEGWAKDMTAEASARVRKLLGNHDFVIATVGSAMAEAVASMRESKDWRNLAQVCTAWANITGASAPKRGEVVHTVQLPDTREELLKLIATEMAAEGMTLDADSIKQLQADSGGNMIQDAEVVNE